MGRQGHPGRRTHPGELLHGNRITNIICAGATILLGEDNPGQTELGDLVKHQLSIEAFILIALSSRRSKLFLCKFTHCLSNQVLLLCQLKEHLFASLILTSTHDQRR